MRDVHVTRYVTPLREGGSMPAVVEADDDGLYVLKFRGAGQGTRALVAELVAGAIAERLGLAIPDRVFAELDVDLGRTEPDPEIQELIQASGGRNLALDFLPGSVNFDPAADGSLVDAELASRVVWFDAFISNVDRSVRNTNLLVWHGRVWLIDHGASLYFHHGWDGAIDRAVAPFTHIADHVLLPWATSIQQLDAELSRRLDEPFLQGVLDLVPDDWLAVPGAFGPPAVQRAAYVRYFLARLEGRAAFVEEAARAQGA
ncbi:MAG: HipA family kinase [Planctomycetota bacterium]